VVARRFDVYLVNLDPTVGSEVRKTRPCVVVSPDDLNEGLLTVIIAPMTTVLRRFSWRPRCRFQGKDGQIMLDQLRTVDRSRLMRRLGRLDRGDQSAILKILSGMFAE
jgi:mRNA interferase MazF